MWTAATCLARGWSGRSIIDEHLSAVLARMLGPNGEKAGLPILSLRPWLVAEADPIARVTAAFLVVVGGPAHPDHDRARRILEDAPGGEAGALAAFYVDGLARIDRELDDAQTPVRDRLAEADARLTEATTADEVAEAVWRALFPQAVGIRGREQEQVRALRDARTVTIEALADDPIRDPAREVLFTSNVLLTIPDPSTDIDALPYSGELRTAIRVAAAEPQRDWFDHPIQIGVEPDANELLYGLRGLDEAIAAEESVGPVTCLLSVSVTHDGLAHVARDYVHAELERAGGLRNLEIVVVTEDDTRELIDEVLVPALGDEGPAAAEGLERVFGVDGPYGRHYSFLKAVLALWHVAVDPSVRATFKIDLDQVFPQDVLRAETGRSMFEHLGTPLWGARARASDGTEIELGLIAGALVNERDIAKGLFTPDVPIPFRLPTADEHIFFSILPQSISTRAEMMARYDGPELDGVSRALERVHVTGGTNGIRVDALRRHQPFTPSWVGRAEDQAYLLSALDGRTPRLGYAHVAGLVMRHDKEAFAGQAMTAAHVSKLIGDDVRILVFSAYVAALGAAGADAAAVRRLLDPFNGCFVSDLQVTLVLLRLALRTLRLFGGGHIDDAVEYATYGAARIGGALEREGDPQVVRRSLAEEGAAWDRYYDAIDAIEAGSPTLRERAATILKSCRTGTAETGAS